MPIWVFRRLQRAGKLPEAWFYVSTTLRLVVRSKKPIADMSFRSSLSEIGFFDLTTKRSVVET